MREEQASADEARSVQAERNGEPDPAGQSEAAGEAVLHQGQSKSFCSFPVEYLEFAPRAEQRNVTQKLELRVQEAADGLDRGGEQEDHEPNHEREGRNKEGAARPAVRRPSEAAATQKQTPFVQH